MSASHDDLIDDLRRVADVIDERAIRGLTEAVSRGAGRRPEADRHLTQARRAIEKAIQALRRAEGSDAASPED